jgi:hypothetical protein
MSKQKRQIETIGWREWIALPELKVKAIKAKVDTGARSSSLHAFGLETKQRKSGDLVRFEIHPYQDSKKGLIPVETRVFDYRKVKSSNGATKIRPVIVTPIEFLGKRWEIELTLANRDEMGFRMLLGREAIRGRMLVDPGKSYYGGKIKAPSIQKKS